MMFCKEGGRVVRSLCPTIAFVAFVAALAPMEGAHRRAIAASASHALLTFTPGSNGMHVHSTDLRHATSQALGSGEDSRLVLFAAGRTVLGTLVTRTSELPRLRLERSPGATITLQPVAGATEGTARQPANDEPMVFWRGVHGEVTTIEPAAGAVIEILGELKEATAINPVPNTTTLSSSHSASFALLPNLPNPFRSVTTLRFTLPSPGRVTLAIFDIAGRRVASLVDERRNAGLHSVDYRSANLAMGRYEARLGFEPANGSARMQSARSIVLLP